MVRIGSMGNRRSTWLAPTLVCGLLLFVPASYVAGYFLTVEEANYWPGERYAARVYHYKWQVTLFKPAGAIESAITGKEVWVVIKSGIEA